MIDAVQLFFVDRQEGGKCDLCKFAVALKLHKFRE